MGKMAKIKIMSKLKGEMGKMANFHVRWQPVGKAQLFSIRTVGTF